MSRENFNKTTRLGDCADVLCGEWEERGGDQIGVPAQILIISRGDGPHSRLLDFLSSRWAVRVNGSEHMFIKNELSAI